MSDQQRTALLRRRRWLKRFGRLVQRLFFRVEISGQEHIPPEGPVLVCFNHFSNLDGPLTLINYPYDLEWVGPGDFKLVFPGQLAIWLYGITLIQRGKADRASLKAMIAHMRAGRHLALAPSGGTWEKGLADVKPGAAYVSQLTQAAILPVGIGGAYRVESRLLMRPRLTVRFGEVMPPVPPSADRRQRDADLQAASREIMQRLYDLLPPGDQALFDRWGREVHELRLDFRNEAGAFVPYGGPPLPDLAALAEFIGKPNLFRPIWQNARLPVEPLMERRFFAAIETQISLRMVEELLAAGDYAAYLAYRLGDAKSAAVMRALPALRQACAWAARRQLQVRLTPVAHDPAANVKN